MNGSDFGNQKHFSSNLYTQWLREGDSTSLYI
jgi:hypothetical protein